MHVTRSNSLHNFAYLLVKHSAAISSDINQGRMFNNARFLVETVENVSHPPRSHFKVFGCIHTSYIGEIVDSGTVVTYRRDCGNPAT